MILSKLSQSRFKVLFVYSLLILFVAIGISLFNSSTAHASGSTAVAGSCPFDSPPLAQNGLAGLNIQSCTYFTNPTQVYTANPFTTTNPGSYNWPCKYGGTVTGGTPTAPTCSAPLPNGLIDNAAYFENFILSSLNNGGDSSNIATVGAASIVDIMLNQAEIEQGADNGINYARANEGTWKNLVDTYDGDGLVQYNQIINSSSLSNLPHTPGEQGNGCPLGEGDDRTDTTENDIFDNGSWDETSYDNNDCSNEAYITFSSPGPGGHILIAINRQCGNITGNIYPFPTPGAVTATASCALNAVTGNATENILRSLLTVNYTVGNNESGPGSGSVRTDSSGNFTIPMDAYDQLTSHLVSITVPSALPGTPPGTTTATFGPCFLPACGSDTLTVPGDVNGAQDGPVPGQPFSTKASIGFTPIPYGADTASGNPTTIGGNLLISFQTLGTQSFAVRSSPYSATANWTGPPASPNPYTYGYDFSDAANGGPGSIVPPCANSTIPVGYHPFLSVVGGSVLVGSGGAGTTCSDPSTATKAGILAFNNGPPNNGGAGTDLASISPDIINGFASSDGNSSGSYSSFNNNAPNGLSFANVDPNSPGPGHYPFDTTFGGGFGAVGSGGCASDYYDNASTAVPSGPTPGDIDLSTLGPSISGCNQTTSNGVVTTSCWLEPTLGNNFVTINGATGLTGKTIVYVNGDAVIASNISLNTGPWASVANIPSLYIVTNANMYIDSSVTHLDGVYVAQASPSSQQGDIFTCTNMHSMFSAAALYTSCNSQLTVNGAFVANQVRFERTFGTVNTATNPANAAENFNYNPEVWLSSPSATGTTLPTNPSYDSVTSLAPVL